MAGSRKWVVYESDVGQKYAVNIDESNAEATDFDDLTPSDSFPRLPQGFTMRYGLFIDPDSGATRKIWIGKPSSPLITGAATAITLLLSGGVTIADWVLFFLRAIISENRGTIPVPFDTALLDGDET